MGQYIAKRLLLAIPTVFVVMIITFSLLRFGGDSIEQLIDSGVISPLNAVKLREQLGLDKPVYVQFGNYVNDLAHGRLGSSITKNVPVTTLFKRAFPVTLELGAIALTFGLLMAIPLGVFAAVKQDTWLDYFMRSTAIGFVAIPNFWIGTLVIIYPAIWWGYAPQFIYTPLTKDLWVNVKQFIVPAFILGLALSGGTMRLTRNLLLEVLRQDYIRTALAKGLKPRVMITRHALKNALIPVVTHVGGQLGIVVGGSAIIETIFNLPGMGRTLVTASSGRDYAVVQSGILMISLFIVTMNLLVDLSYGWLDPRIRFK